MWCASARRQSQLPSDSLAVSSHLLSPVSCVRDLGIYWCWPVDANASHSDLFEVFCCPSTASKHKVVSVEWRVTVARCGVGVLQARLRICDSCRSSETALGQASVRAERRCTADFHSSSSGPRRTTTSQPTLASSPRKDLVPAGGAGVSLPPWFCTRLPGVRSQRVSDVDARLRLRSSSTSALVGPRTRRATIGDRTFLAAAASVWNSLSESVWASSSLPVFRGRLKTELFSCSYSCSD